MDFNKFEPCFLIAMPQLNDPYFHQTVVMLTDYTEDGANGFVINKISEMNLADSVILLDDSKIIDKYMGLSLNDGGPVEKDKIWIVYDGKKYKAPSDDVIGNDIIIAKDIDLLTEDHPNLDSSGVRIFNGYSGWGPGQLDAELARSDWLTLDLKHEVMFEKDSKDIWAKALGALGLDAGSLMKPSSELLN